MPRVPAKLLRFRHLVTAVALLGAVPLVSATVNAEEIDFGQINRFESLATGTLHVGAPPKTIVDDGERHVVVLTIWDADADAANQIYAASHVIHDKPWQRRK